MTITDYIIYVKENEGSQAGAIETGNHTIIEVDNENPSSVAMFKKMRFAFAQEAEHVKIEVLEEQEPINARFTITKTVENTAYMKVPRNVYLQGGDDAIKKYIIEHQDEFHSAEHPYVLNTDIKIV
jgi:hypothetical protein